MLANPHKVLDLYFENYEGRLTGYEAYRPAPYRMRAKALLALHRADEALTAVDIACADPNSVPADGLTRVAILLALQQEPEARAAFASLSASEGTEPYAELLAYAKSLNVDLH